MVNCDNLNIHEGAMLWLCMTKLKSKFSTSKTSFDIYPLSQCIKISPKAFLVSHFFVVLWICRLLSFDQMPVLYINSNKYNVFDACLKLQKKKVFKSVLLTLFFVCIWLFSDSDCNNKCANYDLNAVICHHGTAGGNVTILK